MHITCLGSCPSRLIRHSLVTLLRHAYRAQTQAATTCATNRPSQCPRSFACVLEATQRSVHSKGWQRIPWGRPGRFALMCRASDHPRPRPQPIGTGSSDPRPCMDRPLSLCDALALWSHCSSQPLVRIGQGEHSTECLLGIVSSMKRTRKARDGARQESSAASSTTATASSTSVQSAASSEHESHTRIIATTPSKSSGKRKRSRSQMTTATARERLEEVDSVAAATISKRPRAMEFPIRPSLESHSNSDEDVDMSRNDGPPPPPPYPVPVELVCRYPNKPCPQPRATKKHGELHSYCAYHRLKAQEYQRTLERKKREKRLQEQRSPSTLIAATTISTEPAVVMAAPLFANDVPSSLPTPYRQSPPPRVSSPPARRTGNRTRTRSSPPRSSTVMYAGRRNPEPTPAQHESQHAAALPANLEPYHHPVTLQEDDIQLLQVFLMDPTVPRPTVAWDLRAQPTVAPQVNQRRASATVTARATATNRSNSEREGDGSYAVDLDGFTFTSESI